MKYSGSHRLRSSAVQKCFLLFYICLFCLMSTEAAPLAPSQQNGQWLALLHCRSFPNDRKGLTRGSPDDPNKVFWRNADEKPSWQTFAVNANSRQTLPGLYLACQGHILRLETQTKRKTTKMGKAVSEYRVDQIAAIPLATGKAQCLLGAGELKYANEAYGKYPPQFSQNYEAAHRVLGIYGSCLSVEKSGYSYEQDAAHPSSWGEWLTFRITPGRLVPLSLKLAPALNKKLQAEKKKHVSSFEADVVRDRGIVITPDRGGLRVELAFGASYGAHDDAQAEVMARSPDFIEPGLEKVRAKFVAEHPKFIDWKKASFYSIAPDESGVVYCQDQKLYWKSKPDDSQAILLGACDDLRGLQWVHTGSFSSSENAAMLGPGKRVIVPSGCAE
jgi:hypothetical protein